MSVLEMNRKPNFFIVGAAKSGTSSLWQYLKSHDQVFMPKDELFKEPRYFSHPNRFESEAKYFELFKEATSEHLRIGEASTAYLTCPDCAKKIKEYGDRHGLDIKIIIMLRNPVDRAYSLYNWMVQDGYEYSDSFSKALQKEESRLHHTSRFWEPNYPPNYLYYHSGLYSKQVKRYLDCFGSEHVHIELFENFIHNTEQCLNKVIRFLGIQDSYHVEYERIYNPSYQVYSPKVQFWARKISKLLARFKIVSFASKTERDFMLRWGLRNKKIPKLSTELRMQLLSKYRGDILELQDMVGMDFSKWLNSPQST